MPFRLLDSSVWIEYLRPKPDPRIVADVQEALAADEVAVAAPIVVEVLAGIRDRREQGEREEDFRALTWLPVDGEPAYLAARIGGALAASGKMGKTVDLLLAGAALAAGAELWSLPEEHFARIQQVIRRGLVSTPGPLRLVTVPRRVRP